MQNETNKSITSYKKQFVVDIFLLLTQYKEIKYWNYKTLNTSVLKTFLDFQISGNTKVLTFTYSIFLNIFKLSMTFQLIQPICIAYS